MKTRKSACLLCVMVFFAYASVCLVVSNAEAKEKIVFFSWQATEPANKAYLNELKQAFENKYPDFTVEVTGLAPSEYNSRLLTRISAGQAPDVFAIRPTTLAKLIQVGALEPLDKWLDATDWKEKLLLAQQLAEKDGKNWALIQTSTPQCLIYNKLILKKAGVEVPRTPEDLLSAASKIYKQTGLWGFGTVTDASDTNRLWKECLKWVHGFGGQWSKNGRPTATDPNTIAGVKFMKSLYDADFTPRGMSFGPLRRMIWDQKLAMFVDGAWLFGMTKAKNPETYPNLDAALSPTPTHGAVVGGAFWGMWSGSKNKDGAWKFLDMYNQAEWQQKFLEMTAQIPAQKGMVTDEVLKREEWWKIFDESAAKYACAYGYIPNGFDLVAYEFGERTVSEYLAKILAQNAPVEKTLEELQQVLVKKFVK